MIDGRLGIIIGFEYGNKSNDKLPGTIIDIYRIYKIMEKSGMEEIMLISDINKDKKCENLRKSIINGVVDAGILYFIENMMEKKKYIYCHTLNDIKNLFENVYKYQKIIIYYTGHAKNGDIILPDGNIYDRTQFRTKILEKTNVNSEILIMFDCCQCENLNLPFFYQYDSKEKRSNLKYRLSFCNNKQFIPQKVIYIASASKYEDSATTKKGSYFTLALTNLMKSECSDIYDICKHVHTNSNKSYPQTITIYSTYPNLIKLWSWIFK